MHDRWQSIPHGESGLPGWAEAVAQRQANQPPEVRKAHAEATQAHQIASEVAARQSREHVALHERVLGGRRRSAVAARVKSLLEQAAQDHRYVAQLDALRPDEAVKLVHEHAAQEEVQPLAAKETRKAAETRAKELEVPAHERSRGRSPYRGGPAL